MVSQPPPLALLVLDRPDPSFGGLGSWNSREDAEHYHREQDPKIHEMLKPLLESDPQTRTFNIQSRTTHPVVVSKAA